MVRVDVPGIDDDPLIISPHLKSGTARSDRFRRAIEMRRLTQYLHSAGIADDDHFIVLGDYNPSSTSATFDVLPSGLPESYSLGSDVIFPVSYHVNPVSYFTSPGAVILEALQLNGSPSTFNTTMPGGPALDLILVSPAIAANECAAEIYNSALDISNQAGLPKTGLPLAANTSSTASDHYLVFADLELDAPEPYHFAHPGDAVTEGFEGFVGLRAPSPWFAGGGAWRGADDGSSVIPGWRAYGQAPGYLTGGEAAAISAKFENRSGTPLTALAISLDAEQWRAVNGGAADRMQVDLVTPAGTIPMPGLTFTASQALPTGPVSGGAPVRLTDTVGHLWIPSGDAFELRISFQPGEGGGPAPDDIFINEFHYDNFDADSGEFVEIAVGPGFSGNLSDVSLVLYNGANGQTYGTHKLSTFTSGPVTDSKHKLFHKMIPGLQNDTDGFAVIAGSTVLHFISYEGSFMATNGPALGLVSTDIGVSQLTSEPVGHSALGLIGNGGSSGDFTWTKFTGIAHSPGLPNNGQVFLNPNQPPQGLAFDDLEVVFLTDNDLDGLPDITDPDDDNDGQHDADELAFGTDPLNVASLFAPVIARNESGLELLFPGATGIHYTVEFSESLSGWENLTTVTGEGRPVVVSLPLAEPRMFFRVRAGGP
jgi:hypothetical protein